MKISKEEFEKLADKYLVALQSYSYDRDGNKPIKIYGIEELYKAINVIQCCKSDSELLNIAEHQRDIIKSLNDLKKHYPNKTDYRIASSCGAIQYFVDGKLVHEVNI